MQGRGDEHEGLVLNESSYRLGLLDRVPGLGFQDDSLLGNAEQTRGVSHAFGDGSLLEDRAPGKKKTTSGDPMQNADSLDKAREA